MRRAKLAVVVALMVFILTPTAAFAQCYSTCVPIATTHSWMDQLAVVQVFMNPVNFYKGEWPWDPRFDEDWQEHYCRHRHQRPSCCPSTYCPSCNQCGGR